MTDPAGMRRAYIRGELSESAVSADWLSQFRVWFDAAVADDAVSEPNAMQLATVDRAGHPSVRTVLLKGFDNSGLVFYSNHDSAKGLDLEAAPYAAVVFAWLPQERQVRFSGPVTLVSREETATYFASRPRGSQLGAWASPQSSVVSSRLELEEAVQVVRARFGDDDPVPPPPNWGGYRIAPEAVEFWQGRADRLHDRIRYRRNASGWVIERLAP
ncbi:pyridoxamine 5'-phosphate oxidase [Jatrophihabitans sp. GAS493]|uniref:pyridoxamine 5'-phosphate oxidase n=1 Tax=Jatrophihabitans sp. GAS493 TaxID=1907575 RepID=UPI000BBF6CB1|nr:pyridoxamine 5'-phosphate oxidase [Jatrophihabitans sp. GAS493]SOD70417.1 pyridoxamine 5'-phosphate oxidase [Jatrophihabitans sp. GAS493]